MSENVEFIRAENGDRGAAERAHHNLQAQALSEMSRPNAIRASDNNGINNKPADMAAADQSIKSLTQNHPNISAPPSSPNGVRELSISYPPNADGKSIPIKIGLNEKNELVQMGDQLAKGKDGLFRSTSTGEAARYQNNFFDAKTGRLTYQTGTNEGKWIDPDGKTGKVNFQPNGSRAYLSPAGKHEYTIRSDGSKYDPVTKTISGAPEKFVKQPNGRAHIGSDGRHDYTINNDGSIYDVATRTRTRQLENGGREVTHADGRKVTFNSKDQVLTAGTSKYNQLEYKYNARQELTNAAKIYNGQRTVIWDKRAADAGTASVDSNGILTVSKPGDPIITYDRQLVRREFVGDYKPGDSIPSRVVKANGDERQITGDKTAGYTGITDIYRSRGHQISRTLDGDQMTIQTEHNHRNARPFSETSLRSAPNAQYSPDAQGNLKVVSGSREYNLRLADMRRVKTVQRRNR